MWVINVNGFFGFVMLITYYFTLSNFNDILATSTGYPFIQAFYNGIKSYAGALIMTVILIVMVTSSVISTLATVSR
jgi:formylmethanofuran dehydrogenase subunit B